MYFNKSNSFDDNLRLAVAQSITATDVGKDAGGTPIELDVSNHIGQNVSLSLRYSADATADVLFTIQQSNDATFATGVLTDECYVHSPGPAGQYAPDVIAVGVKKKYARLRAVHTAGAVSNLTAWIAAC